MRVLHLVTNLFPPFAGGMEMWTLRLAQGLTGVGVKVIVYIGAASNEFDYADRTEVGGIEIRLMAKARSLWQEPFTASQWPESRVAPERFRLEFLTLRNAIAKEMARFPGATHLVASNFITGPGFVAANVAEDLTLPHLACVVGTDFSRGLRNPSERAAMGIVVAQAAVVVTRSHEQAEGVTRGFGAKNVVMIHAAVDDRVFGYTWKPQLTASGHVNLFTDSGYSHKKGTQVLMDCFATLHAERIPVRLTICGGTLSGQGPYWQKLRKDYSNRFRGDIDLQAYVDPPHLWDVMQASDIYCSATLGEGCSLARSSALCMGMPIVTTRCGEMPDVAADARHVWMAPPGDRDGYLEQLRSACHDALKKSIAVDPTQVQEWRTHFSPVRELELWCQLLDRVA